MTNALAPVAPPGGLRRDEQRQATSQLALRALTRAGAGAVTLVAVHIETARFGRTGWGAFATATALVTLLGVLEDLGLETVGARQLSEQPGQRHRLFAASLSLRIALSIAAAGAAIGIAALSWGDHQLLRLVAGLSPLLVADAILSATAAVFQAAHRLAMSGAMELVGSALALAAAIAVVAGHLSLTDLAVTTGAAALGAAASSLWTVRSLVTPAIEFDVRQWGGLLVAAAPFGVMLVVNTAYAQIDTLLLAGLRGTAAVGIYGVATLAMQAVTSIGSFALAVALPRLATTRGPDHRQWVRWLVEVQGGLVLPVIVGTALLAPSLVRLFAGPGFDAAAAPLEILMAGAVLMLPTGLLATTLVADHRESLLLPVGVAVLAVNVGLNLGLAPRWGAAGAAVALSASEAVALVATAVQFRRSQGTPRSFVRPSSRSVAAACAPAVVWAVMVPTGVAMPGPLAQTMLVGGAMALAVAACWLGDNAWHRRADPPLQASRQTASAESSTP